MNWFCGTKKKVVDTKKKILSFLSNENYLCTDFETPIFTVWSNKYESLYKELLMNGIISEPCNIFLNLDEKFARIRINKDYDRIIEVLKKVL